MSHIKIERNHSFGVEGARERADKIAAKLEDRFNVRFEWTGNTAAIKGKGVSGGLSGTFAIEESRVTVEIKLGMMLRPMKGKIQQGIERALDKQMDA